MRFLTTTAPAPRIRPGHRVLPVCSYCLAVRDDYADWQLLDKDKLSLGAASLSHGICPRCLEEIVKPELHRSLSRADHAATDR